MREEPCALRFEDGDTTVPLRSAESVRTPTKKRNNETQQQYSKHRTQQQNLRFEDGDPTVPLRSAVSVRTLRMEEAEATDPNRSGRIPTVPDRS